MSGHPQIDAVNQHVPVYKRGRWLGLLAGSKPLAPAVLIRVTPPSDGLVCWLGLNLLLLPRVRSGSSSWFYSLVGQLRLLILVALAAAGLALALSYPNLARPAYVPALAAALALSCLLDQSRAQARSCLLDQSR